MDEATYCIKVCKAKCCYLHTPWGEGPIRCPRLSEDNSCSVYNYRYGELLNDPLVIVGRWESKEKKAEFPFYCGHIKEIIAKGLLPKHIEVQCCYAHQELLETIEEPCVTK